LNQRLDRLEPKILDRSFRTGRGKAGEVNFWIFDYAPQDEMAVRSHVEYLVSRVNSKNDDVCIKCFDLYGLMMDILRGKNYLDKVIKMEEDKGSAAVINPLKRTLRLEEKENNLIIAKITENLTPQKDIVFLIGVGKAWPIVNSNSILSILHSRIEGNPLVMFFPGEYTDELKLFGEIVYGNHYRALKLF
jgi:hypothetical protein